MTLFVHLQLHNYGVHKKKLTRSKIRINLHFKMKPVDIFSKIKKNCAPPRPAICFMNMADSFPKNHKLKILTAIKCSTIINPLK